MPSKKLQRIEIDQRAYDALQVEAILSHRTIREIASEAVLKHVSPEAKAIIDQKACEPLERWTVGPKGIEIQETVIPEDCRTTGPIDHKTIESDKGQSREWPVKTTLRGEIILKPCRE